MPLVTSPPKSRCRKAQGRVSAVLVGGRPRGHARYRRDLLLGSVPGMGDTTAELPTGPGARTETRRPFRISADQLLFFNRQLASMARLNMPLAKGLRILAREVDDP